MNLRQPFLIIATLILFVTHTQARTWTPDNLPVPYLQDNRQYVSNPDGVLSAETVDSINVLLNQLEHEKGVQALVIAVTNIEGDDPYDFCMRLGRKYGIGSKQSTGLIVLLASDDRGYQILTGNGLEGTLPDAICRRIQNRITIPLLREGKWDEAMLRTVAALKGCIDGDEAITSDGDGDEDGEAAAFALAAFFCAGVAGISIAFVALKRKKCPRCSKARMRTVSRKRVKIQGSSLYRWRVERQCPKCKYTQVDYEDDNDDFHDATSRAFPPVIGSGGSRSGSSFPTGGAFGGGTFGGGGSGGHF